jgi:decaprenylphospho-beta-D-ribofuranose 2-oxidase
LSNRGFRLVGQQAGHSGGERLPGTRGAGPRAQTRLVGWGRIAPTRAEVAQPASAEEVARLLRHAPERGVIARGLGRSYNNAAQNDGGLVISTTRMNRITGLDPSTGLVTCEAGVSLEQIMCASLPGGWFVPVSPGTRQVTVGGAIAADVHGKNHHRAGSFAQHVRWLNLLLPTGQEVRVTPEAQPELFWATAGGMGLTGMVLQAAIQLIKVETSRVRVDTVRTADLDETMAGLKAADHRSGYSVAWLDCLATGASLGRSVITSGDFATTDQLAAADRRQPLAFRPTARIGAPACPPGLITRPSVRLASQVWYHRAPRRRTGEIQTINAFFHPLDAIRNWNRVYGPAGLRQYQCVVPAGQDDALRRSVEMISRARAPSFVTVLKRFGPGSPGDLSFPLEGWTLALDFPARTPGLSPLLDRLDELVAGVGGRVYLAKDSRVSAEMLGAMYPGLAEFRSLRERIDPAGRLASDLSRRLRLC